MTKDVILNITGMQFNDRSNDEPIELITRGNYYKKNNKHYVIYDEIMEGISGTTKNTIKFGDSFFQLTNSGAINTSMVFEENKKNVTNYNTPFGSIVIGLDASNISVEELEDEISVNVDYSIDANCEYLADCNIKMKIQATGK